MKTWSMNFRSVVQCSCLLLSLMCICVRAQLSIDWYTIDGGGGTSTNAQYAVSGTIGQTDARSSPMTGGSFSLTGGFWAFHAIQTAGAPFLSIVPAGVGQASISWNPDDPGWVLQEAQSLSPASWTNSPSGITNPVVVPAVSPTKFFRLFKP